LVWFAPGNTGGGDILSPGSHGVIRFQASANQDVILNVGNVKEDERPFPWDSIEAKLRIPGISDTEWNAIWSAMTTSLGNTYATVLQSLRTHVQYSATPISLDDLLRAALLNSAFSDDQPLQSVSVSGDNPPVNDYTLDIAWGDVTLYDRANKSIFPEDIGLNVACCSRIPVREGAIFSPSLPTIFVTHGWHDGHSSGNFIDLVEELAKEYPPGQYNIVRLVWDIGAETPLECSLRRFTCGANRVSERAPFVAIIARLKLTALGFSQWDQSIYIGHSFGNAVNAYIADRQCKPCGTGLLLNAASSIGFNLRGVEDQPNYPSIFRRSIAIYTYDVADQWWRKTMGHITLQYEFPDCGGVVCLPEGNAHGSTPRLIACFLGADDNGNNGEIGGVSCGLINKSQHAKARDLVQGNRDALQLQDGVPYYIDATGRIYRKEVAAVHCYHGGYCNVIYDEVAINPEIKDQATIRPVRAIDPNDKVGPVGMGEQRIIGASNSINYTINFENLSTATAPVQELRITDQLDANLDWTTFAFDSIAYGDNVLSVGAGPGVLEYETRHTPSGSVIAGTAEGELAIDIRAHLDMQTGQVVWTLKVIDTATGDFPADPLAGFLPPENGSGRGQGYVTFSVKPKSDIALGTVIRNKASIVFDTNDAIETNEVSNLVAEAADLVLVAQGPALGLVGQALTLHYTVFNDGPDRAANVAFTATLGQGASLVSLTASQGACAGLTCSLSNIEAGSTANVTIVITPVDANQVENTGVVTTETIELNAVDNTSTTVTTITAVDRNLFLPLIAR
jgi:uncharacterized repeat protein (TIGR01451 family)